MARLRIETAPEITVYDESFVIKAAAGASAPLAEFKNSAGTVVGNIAVDGTLNVLSVVTSNAGTSSTSLATRGYVDTVAAGLNWHDAVAYATAAALSACTYANGTAGVGATLTGNANARLTVDGTSQTTGKSILVKNQATATQNGIYTITEQGSVSTPFVLTRRTDSNNSVAGQVSAGDSVYVVSGSSNGGQAFILTTTGTGTNDAIVLGTDNLSFSQFTGTAAFLVGDGMVKTGNSIDVVSANGTRIVVNADSIDLATVAQSNTSGANTTSFISGHTVDSYGRITATETSSVSFTGYATLASPTFTGAVTIPATTAGGNIVPSSSNTYSLGSINNVWKDVFVGPGSLYVNGQKVLQDESGAIVVSATIDNNLGLRTSGSGNIELDPTGTGVINIKGPLVIQAATNITSADGNAVTFGGAINTDTISSKTTNTDLSITANGTGKVYINDNAEVSGNLTVNGTITSINSETISFADNIIDLNSNFTTGSPTENAGLRVIRGDSANAQLRWNETSDVWEFTNDGSVYSAMVSLASPTFTGTPTLPTGTIATTQTPANNSTAVATTAYVDAAGALKANLASPTFTGTPTLPTGTIATTQTAANNSTAVATTAYVDTAGALKANLASPTFTGVPAAPTAAASTNTTQVATTAFVRAEVAALVGSAGATLDTLGEIATALGNDVALSTTLTTSIGLKAPLASPTFTGTPLSTTAAVDTNTTQIATTAYVVGQSYAKLASPTFTGTVTLPSGTVTSTMILDGTIANADISTTAAIDQGKIADTILNAQVASYTLVLADKNKLVEISNASANTLTVPPNSSVAFPIGSTLTVLQTGAGQCTITAGAGVTVNGTPGLKLRTTWSSATLIKRATDTWVALGDLVA